MPDATLPSARGRFGLAQLLFLLLLAAMLGQMAWYYPRLPERMASHFNMTGQADSFMPKEVFVKMHLVVVGLMTVVFLLVPMLIVRLPASMINLPNKDYWLDPERRDHTARVIQGHMVGFGNIMLLFLLVAFREVMRAALMPVPHLPKRMWVMLVLLFVFMIVWTVRFMRAFRLPD